MFKRNTNIYFQQLLLGLDVIKAQLNFIDNANIKHCLSVPDNRTNLYSYGYQNILFLTSFTF
jgi:hypothetical protein